MFLNLGGCKEVSIQLACELKNVGINVIPGKKICPSCSIKLSSFKNTGTGDPTSHIDHDDDTEHIPNDYLKEKLNSSLTSMDISPIKMHAVSSHSRVAHGKKKLLQVQQTLKSEISTALNIDPENLNENVPPKIYKYIHGKARDMDRLIEKIKEKMVISNRNQKIQLLTLVPTSWSYKNIDQEFNVTNYMARTSRELLQNKVIPSYPEKKKGKEISQDVVDKIIDFYCDDENSTQMPGKKDFASISRRTHMQKRLILSNLKELYAKVKNTYPDIKIGFSTFCLHRLKWCITVGASGTHTVCVCTIHQNVKLMISAVKLSKDYHELIDMIVCSRANRVYDTPLSFMSR